MTREQQRRRVEELCRERGIRIEQRGRAWRLRGAGVDLLVADLGIVDERTLAPYRPRNDEHDRG